MATAAELLALRVLLSEPDDTDGWTDERLSELLSGNDTINGAAAAGWGIKAGEYAELVNVSESGSSRSLGDLQKKALEMAGYYRSLDTTTGAGISGGPVISRIRRGFS